MLLSRNKQGKEMIIMKKTVTTTEMTEVQTDLICLVQSNHKEYKANELKAEELAERDANAKAYSKSIQKKRNKRKEKLQIAIGILGFAGVIFLSGIVGNFDYEEAKAKEKGNKSATEMTEQKYIVRNGNIYGDKIVTTDGNEWLLIDAPIYSEGTEVRVLFDSKGTVKATDDEIIDITERQERATEMRDIFVKLFAKLATLKLVQKYYFKKYNIAFVDDNGWTDVYSNGKLMFATGTKASRFEATIRALTCNNIVVFLTTGNYPTENQEEKQMTVEILWAKDKTNLATHSWQTKTFESEEKALEWCRKNGNHIVAINNSRYFFEESISHFDIMDALRNRQEVRQMFEYHLDKEIHRKQNFAREHAKCIDCLVLNAVLEQIEFCEELGKGLTESQILKLLQLKSEIQVENFCHSLKIAQGKECDTYEEQIPIQILKLLENKKQENGKEDKVIWQILKTK